MTDRLRKAIKTVLASAEGEAIYFSPRHIASLAGLEAELKASNEALFRAKVTNVQHHHIPTNQRVDFTVAIGEGRDFLSVPVSVFIAQPGVPVGASSFAPEIMAQRQTTHVAVIVKDDDVCAYDVVEPIADTRRILTDEQVKLINAILTPFTESSLYRDYKDVDGWTDDQFNELLAALQS